MLSKILYHIKRTNRVGRLGTQQLYLSFHLTLFLKLQVKLYSFATFSQTTSQFIPNVLKKGIHKIKNPPLGEFLNSETVGFEPTIQVAPYNTLAGCRLQPTRPRLRDIKFIITQTFYFEKPLYLISV